MMLVLGIETSCDETAAAVLRGDTILSNVVSSQVKVHEKYGGVVPELASRHHVENIDTVLSLALREAGVELPDLEGVAVTRGPGLVGSLLVGISVAKGLSYVLGIPFTGVNHLEGHVRSPFLEDPGLPLPALCLVASGGHTALYLLDQDGRCFGLARTRDDAAGEAFDKVAKLLGLGYPGGPLIEREAREGNPEAIPFPRATFSNGGLDFSFSGLKTAVVQHLHERHRPGASGERLAIGPDERKDICASFQQAAVDMLTGRVMQAARELGVGRVVVAGGVACNDALRRALLAETEAEGIQLFLPPPALCTDNAAMIAAAGTNRLRRGERAGWDLNAVPNLPLV
jgi:N6-L-threonylcarbamoyladenine synthase